MSWAFCLTGSAVTGAVGAGTSSSSGSTVAAGAEATGVATSSTSALGAALGVSNP